MAVAFLGMVGKEILAQTNGKLDAFICGAGTGGTIAGVSQVLKQHDRNIQIVLADPPGSSLYNRVRFLRFLLTQVLSWRQQSWCSSARQVRHE